MIQIGELQRRLNELAKQVTSLREERSQERKDAWDKLGTVSTLVSGVLVAGIGFYATTIYDASKQREEEARELERLAISQVAVVEKLIPHLASDNEERKEAALISLAALGNEELAADLARAFGGSGARTAIGKLTDSASPEVAAVARATVADLFDSLRPSVVRIEYDNGAGAGFFVSRNGLLVTAAHLAECLQEIEFAVRLYDDERVPGSVVRLWPERDVALLKAEISNPTQGLPLRDAAPRLGMEVFALGQTREEAWVASFGTVTDTEVRTEAFETAPGVVFGGGVDIEVSIRSYGGFSGAPVVDAAGELVGFVHTGVADQPVTNLVTAEAVERSLREADVDA